MGVLACSGQVTIDSISTTQSRQRLHVSYASAWSDSHLATLFLKFDVLSAYLSRGVSTGCV